MLNRRQLFKTMAASLIAVPFVDKKIWKPKNGIVLAPQKTEPDLFPLFKTATENNLTVYDDQNKMVTKRLVALMRTIYRRHYSYYDSLTQIYIPADALTCYDKNAVSVTIYGIRVVETKQLNRGGDIYEWFCANGSFPKDYDGLVLGVGKNNVLMGSFAYPHQKDLFKMEYDPCFYKV